VNSLRDQLLKAGFKEPIKSRVKSKRRDTAQKRRQIEEQRSQEKTQDLAKIAQRKALKEQIAALINTHKIKDIKGEVVHHYTVGSRIKQLYLSEEVHKRLIADEIVITRLNGETCLIPTGISNDILALNPDWAVYTTESQASDAKVDCDYQDFPIPDDLKW